MARRPSRVDETAVIPPRRPNANTTPSPRFETPTRGSRGSAGACESQTVLTHRIVHGLLPWVLEAPRTDSEVLLAVVAMTRNLGVTPTREDMVLHSYLVTMSRRYLADLVPAGSWQRIGDELDSGAGLSGVDVAWRDVHGRVFYDQLVADSWSVQRWRWYARAASTANEGLRRHGCAFLGVRALLLASPAAGYLVAGDCGSTRPIDPTPDSPFQHAGEEGNLRREPSIARARSQPTSGRRAAETNANRVGPLFDAGLPLPPVRRTQ